MEISIEAAIAYISLYGLKFLGAIAILFIGKYILKHIVNALRNLMRKARIDEILISFGCNSLYGIGLAFIIIAALSQIGIHTTSLAAVIASAGLAVGLALQGSLSNLAAGVMLTILRPFKIGDFISAAGTMGTVEVLNIFTTTLKTPDNKEVIVPNSKITDDIITNFSARDSRRLDLVFRVSYSDDIKKTKEILQRIISEDNRILKEPAATIGVLELGDSSVNFAVRPWVKTSEYWNLHFDLTEKVKIEFDKHGITIPFPQRDVHLFNEK